MVSTANGRSIAVLGLGGSMRTVSVSRLALGIALDGARAAGARTSSWPAGTDPLPFYVPGAPRSPIAERYLAAVSAAEGFIWSTPAYHGSVSAPVKNLLDHLDELRESHPPFLAGKVVGVISVGNGSMGPVQAASALVQIAHALRAVVVPLQVAICESPDALPGERIVSPKEAGRLTQLGQLVVATAHGLRPALAARR